MARFTRTVTMYARCLAILLVTLLPAGSKAAGEDRDQWQQPARVMADLGLRRGSTVADIGCGSGYFTLRLAKAVGPTGKVFAVDPSADALNALRGQIERDHLGNVEVVASEPVDTKLPSARCDCALFCDVLHEVPQDQRAPLVGDTVRTMKKGGFLFVIDYRKSHEVKFDPYEKLIPRENLVRYGTDAGLVLDAEFHYLKYQVFLRFRKP